MGELVKQKRTGFASGAIGFCFAHDPVRREAAQAARSMGGKATRKLHQQHERDVNRRRYVRGGHVTILRVARLGLLSARGFNSESRNRLRGSAEVAIGR